MHLKKMGFQVESSFNGKDAVAMAQKNDYSLIFMDCDMPVMNGYELIRAVRANVLLSSVRIMMVTTETSMNQVETALSAGANEYLMKPFTKEVLLEKLALLGIS